MSKADTANQVISVEGDLLFSTVVAKRTALLSQLQKAQGPCQLDFSAVGRVDSSALSLWFCCERFAVDRGIELTAINIPEDLLSIARLVGVEDNLH